MFLTIKRSDFSEIFSRGLRPEYHLLKSCEKSLKWYFKTASFLLYFNSLKLHSQFSRKRSNRIFNTFIIVNTTVSSRSSRRHISKYYLWWQVTRSYVKWGMVTWILVKSTPFHMNSFYNIPVTFDFLSAWSWCFSKIRWTTLTRVNREQCRARSHWGKTDK